jgi:hypothetical protein
MASSAARQGCFCPKADIALAEAARFEAAIRNGVGDRARYAKVPGCRLKRGDEAAIDDAAKASHPALQAGNVRLTRIDEP